MGQGAMTNLLAPTATGRSFHEVFHAGRPESGVDGGKCDHGGEMGESAGHGDGISRQPRPKDAIWSEIRWGRAPRMTLSRRVPRRPLRRVVVQRQVWCRCHRGGLICRVLGCIGPEDTAWCHSNGRGPPWCRSKTDISTSLSTWTRDEGGGATVESLTMAAGDFDLSGLWVHWTGRHRLVPSKRPWPAVVPVKN